jgi:hypothetical protein
MRRLLLLLMIAIATGFVACNSAADKAPQDVASIRKDSSKFTTIQWLDTAIDFGTAKKGEKVIITFRCKNTGDKPLYLFDVRPGCGCTLADYTKEPIAPGKEGKIDAQFDTNKGIVGSVHKTVSASSNTSNDATRTLKFSGTVLPADSTVAVKK